MLPTNFLSVSPLADIDNVIKYSEADKPLFEELYQVLKKHNAQERFGVTLLHSHFDLAENEVLLESTDKKTRRQTIKPVTLDELSLMETIETAWRLDAYGIEPVFRCQVETTSVPPQHVDRP